MFGRRRILGIDGVQGFYPMSIPYSARFDPARSCKLSRTPGAAGDKKKWTYSFWMKPTPGYCVLSAGTGLQEDIVFASSSSVALQSYEGTTSAAYSSTFPLVLRDPASWVHCMFVWDSAQATAANRLKFYMNGVQVTGGTIVHPQNYELSINATELHQIGDQVDGTYHGYLNGYLAEVYLVDGAALDPTTFGQFSSQNSNVWVPKTPTGLTYGTNGFHLAFGNAAALGSDTSGQGNNYTSSGLASTDQMQDTPTNNACVLNALTGSGALSEGNLKMAAGDRQGTFFVSSGLWAWKYTQTAAGNLGIISSAGTKTSISGANNDVTEVELDLDAGTLKKRVNGGVLTSVATGLSGLFTPYFEAPGTVQFIGFTPTDTTRKALCSANLPDPAIIDSTKGFDAKAYTGTGAAANITSFNFQPDLAWIKSRGAARHHRLVDSVRGATKELYSSDPSQEVTEAQGLTTFLTNGFSLGTSVGYNGNAEAYAAWCWRKLAAAGFDIVGYTGTGANRTVAHGLGAVPELIIIKDRTTGATHWPVYHAKANASPQNGGMYLCESSGFFSAAGFWNSTAPTSSVFSLGNNAGVNNNGDSYIAYLFRSVPGFSLLGSYTGNGNADGPFVYCGFRPRMVLLKRADADGYDWEILDAARDTTNVGNKLLAPDVSSAENTSNANIIDFLSNGFKIRSTNGTWNTNTGTHVFAAFAEAPFKYANAR